MSRASGMLEAQGLVKEYSIGQNRLVVLKGISTTIQKGEIVGIIGPSGAGKSTLLHLLGGLDSPTQGKVLFEGQDISTLSDKQRARLRNQRFGFVFQFYHLLPEFTALENVMLPALMSRALSKREARTRSETLLNRCGLRERLEHRPSELSGGEQQRVAIARALINTPQILFCDEPTGNLDTETGAAITALLWQLNKDLKMTLVIVTHAADVAQNATRVIHLRDGKIVA